MTYDVIKLINEIRKNEQEKVGKKEVSNSDLYVKAMRRFGNLTTTLPKK